MIGASPPLNLPAMTTEQMPPLPAQIGAGVPVTKALKPTGLTQHRQIGSADRNSSAGSQNQPVAMPIPLDSGHGASRHPMRSVHLAADRLIEFADRIRQAQQDEVAA